MSALDDIKARAEGHTQGPWEIAADLPTWEDEEGEFYLGPADAPTVATAGSLADAELIAVAPNLLAALEAVEVLHVPILEYGDPVGCRTCDWDADGEWPCQTARSINEALEGAA